MRVESAGTSTEGWALSPFIITNLQTWNGTKSGLVVSTEAQFLMCAPSHFSTLPSAPNQNSSGMTNTEISFLMQWRVNTFLVGLHRQADVANHLHTAPELCSSPALTWCTCLFPTPCWERPWEASRAKGIPCILSQTSKQGWPYGWDTYVVTQHPTLSKDPAFAFTLSGHHLEILSLFWTRGFTFLLCTQDRNKLYKLVLPQNVFSY